MTVGVFTFVTLFSLHLALASGEVKNTYAQGLFGAITVFLLAGFIAVLGWSVSSERVLF